MESLLAGRVLLVVLVVAGGVTTTVLLLLVVLFKGWDVWFWETVS